MDLSFFGPLGFFEIQDCFDRAAAAIFGNIQFNEYIDRDAFSTRSHEASATAFGKDNRLEDLFRYREVRAIFALHVHVEFYFTFPPISDI
ncbi:MAG: hypothetical protein QOF72_2543 [Blastocatellia bacterium]|nr:hypothetical protein [Blastocatellia bacterium]